MIHLNGHLVMPTIFPDKTSQVWKIPEEFFLQESVVTWSFDEEGELLHLAQLKMLLDAWKCVTCLKLPYLPYGRQDHAITNGHTFALRTFARLLNSLEFSRVTITDPHSSSALVLIHNSEAIYPTKEVRQAFIDTKSNIVCYADEGALKKYVCGWIYYSLQYMHGTKSRDQSTGKILFNHISTNPLGQVVLIVDDICDGGSTFIMLAKKLFDAGAAEVHLFVSHGLFSKGHACLREAGIKRIFTKEGEIL